MSIRAAEREELIYLHQVCDRLASGLAELQARAARGARARPDLSLEVDQLQRALFASFEALEKQMVDHLRGVSDDVAMGRLAQAEELTDAEAAQPLDRERREALLALLLLWRRGHGQVTAAFAHRDYDRGRMTAFREWGHDPLPPEPRTRALRVDVERRYEADVTRLYDGLRDGTSRAMGLVQIVETSGSVGEALQRVRALFKREAYRIGLLAESLVWTAWSDGYRAGAVDLHEAIRRENPSLAVEKLPHYQWTGPADAVACGPCIGMFGAPLTASSLDALPAPQSICRYGRACRHWWSLFTETT